MIKPEDLGVLAPERIETNQPTRMAEDLVGLIQAMASGEEEALAVFYDRTSQRVYGLIGFILRDKASAEEVTLDVYLQVWRDAPHYRKERGSALAWLMTLARSRALDRLRRVKTEHQQQRVEWPEEEEWAADDVPLDESVMDAERAHRVHAALAQLSPEQRQVLGLAYFQGLSHGEIAERLAIPLGTIKTRIRSGMQRLQELLSPWFNENL